jgi:hypothetical protein
VKVQDETWNTHQWLSNPRRLAIEPGRVVLQHHCVRCGRDFVMDPSSNSSHAVFVSAISFDQLSDEVTKRWLKEPCPGTRLPPDDVDRTNIVAVFRVSYSADLKLPVGEVPGPDRSDSAKVPLRAPVHRATNRRS